VRREQRRQPRGIAARHAAFGADAVDAHVTARRREPRGVALGVVVMNEAEIEFGVPAKLRPFIGAK
jgi:hypothetical protein